MKPKHIFYTMNAAHEIIKQEIRDFFNGRRKAPLLSVIHNPDYRQMAGSEEALLARACEVIQKELDAPSEGALPSYFPDYGTVSTAALFGGKIIPPVGHGFIHIEPAAKTLDELLSLTPRPFEESDYQKALNQYRALCERLGRDDIYLRTPDFQGPLNTLALLIDQRELMAGMYECPEIIHEAARRVTDTLIEYVGRYRDEAGADKVIGNIWPYVSLPDGKGVGITQDYMPLIGPEHYEEFEIPHLRRISKAFGGVFIHCCGRYGCHIPALKRSGIKILGLECHYPETRIEDIYEAFGDSVAITPYIAPTGGAAAGAPTFRSVAELIRSWKGKPCANSRLWLATCHENGDAADLRRAIQNL